MEPRQSLIPSFEHGDIFTLPEYVQIERTDDVIIKNELLLKEAQIRAVAAMHGAAKVMDMTPGQALRQAIENGKRDKDKAIDQLIVSRSFLVGLGFKKRIETIDEMLTEIKDAVRSAE
jgi:hypothetical protein